MDTFWTILDQFGTNLDTNRPQLTYFEWISTQMWCNFNWDWIKLDISHAQTIYFNITACVITHKCVNIYNSHAHTRSRDFYTNGASEI